MTSSSSLAGTDSRYILIFKIQLKKKTEKKKLISINDNSLNKFYVSIGINVAVGLTLTLLFGLLYRRRAFGISTFFAPNANALHFRIGNKATTFVFSIFGWIIPSFSYPDNALLLTHGPDALVFVMFLRVCLFLVALVAVPSLLIILPLNYSGKEYVTNAHITKIGRLSMSNLAADSSKLTAHALFTWVYSFVFYGVMWWSYKTYSRLRQRYLNRPIPSNHTLMFEYVPVELLTKQAFTNWVKAKYPFKIVRSFPLIFIESIIIITPFIKLFKKKNNPVKKLLLRLMYR